MKLRVDEIVREIVRRNTKITVFRSCGGLCVEKKYSATYSVSDELAAYATVTRVVQDVKGVDVASIVDVDEAANALYLRYVEGESLADQLSSAGIEVALLPFARQLLEVFAKAHFSCVTFDADPSNFLVTGNPKSLVIIDPVAQDQGLKHASMVIFLFGLVKYRLKFIYRFCDYRAFATLWSELIESYLRTVGARREDIYRELSSYSQTVANWNCERSSSESVLVRGFRVTVLARVWRIFGWWFGCMAISAKY